MNAILEDLTTLPPKRLAKRLEELTRDALPCLAANVFDGNPQDGLTVGLWVESQGRRDVLDLARVLETEPRGHVSTSWALAPESRKQPDRRLLLRVQIERPVICDFVVRFDVRDHPSDRQRAALPLLLAATGFALCFNGFQSSEKPITWIPAPLARECVFDVLSRAGV